MEDPSTGDDGERAPPLKRRKVRKGTQSCWECKRRKIRCTFVKPTESVCDGCKSRRVKCISQEFDEEVTGTSSKMDRLGRMEAVVEELARRTGTNLPNPQPRDRRGVNGKGSVKDLGTLSNTYGKTMSRLVETVSKLVTSDDDLVCSLEGIECIMIEAMYYNNAGNLRRAWITHRRAMVIAQLLGLHRSDFSSVKLLDADSRGRIDPEHMWYRLIISDRYLSLMLGLPQGFLEGAFDSPAALESCAPMERMERMESIAGGLILQRNGADIHNLETTREIDKLLQEAAALMPPQWWLIPDVAAIIGDDKEALRETLRIMNQFTHYHLLAQVHLPYLLQPSDDRKYDYSKITAVIASREILSRFVSFRGSDSITAYCRGIDLLAFIASTIVGLAHIGAGRQQQQQVDTNDCTTGLHLFAHQRLSDRGLLERTLQCVQQMARCDKDVMACKISDILQHLLAIEEAAANGVSYSTGVSAEPGEPEAQYNSEATDMGDALRIHIPYFGTITIEHCDAMESIEVEHSLIQEVARPRSVQGESRSDMTASSEHTSPQKSKGNQAMRAPTPSVPHPAGFQIGGEPANTDWQTVPSHLDSLRTEAESASATLVDESLFEFDHTGIDTASLLVPGLTADVDDWALQGVDMALFDNLIRGASDPAAESNP
ncbi:Transcription factor [Pleurostoma richardsiae]|uniref:Transcription factor n=1 Tax=Pleurostoma richardsiae TaxID=41990 RepID=A0AA38S3D1_9PEZI|nr:Transcription factor [Pleurostoma richardsiae]